MSTHPVTDPRIREHILCDPAPVLEDPEIMRALVAAEDAARGPNVVDLRSVAMAELEARLARLEETHSTVVAAAYDNLASANLIHRAVLTLLEPQDFGAFLTALSGPVAESMRATSLRLVLESEGVEPGLEALPDVLVMAEPGACLAYAGSDRTVTLRRVEARATMHGPAAPRVLSEACLMLDLGPDRRPGMLVLGATAEAQFAPGQGTDLLAFFAGAFERSLRRFLS